MLAHCVSDGLSGLNRSTDTRSKDGDVYFADGHHFRRDMHQSDIRGAKMCSKDGQERPMHISARRVRSGAHWEIA